MREKLVWQNLENRSLTLMNTSRNCLTRLTEVNGKAFRIYSKKLHSLKKRLVIILEKISIRVQTADMDIIRKMASERGLRPHTYLSSVVHQFAAGHLRDA